MVPHESDFVALCRNVSRRFLLQRKGLTTPLRQYDILLRRVRHCE